MSRPFYSPQTHTHTHTHTTTPENPWANGKDIEMPLAERGVPGGGLYSTHSIVCRRSRSSHLPGMQGHTERACEVAGTQGQHAGGTKSRSLFWGEKKILNE